MIGVRISGNKIKALLHVVVWAVLFIFPAYLILRDSERDKVFALAAWLQFAFYAVIFYTSYLWLAPRYFFSGKKRTYFIYSGIVILFFTVFLGLIFSWVDPQFRGAGGSRRMRPGMMQGGMQRVRAWPPPGQRPPSPVMYWPLFNFLLTSGLVTGLSLGLRFSEKLVLNEKIRKEAEKEKLHTELSLLKHQINPHFLFNTLNSIYSLALVKSDQTAEAVMKLSEMMRYVFQDAEQEMVPLAHELEYVGNYVEFQKIRLSGNMAVDMQTEGDPQPYRIPPMILIPFIENAFKYGTSSHENSVIRIAIRIGGGMLDLFVSNRVFPGRSNAENPGIGIQNTSRRLNLLYPARHRLVLTEKEGVFKAELNIRLV